MLQQIQKYRVLIGSVLWLIWMLAVHPLPLDVAWGRGILLLAPLVIVPMATDVLTRTAPFSASQLLPKILRWQLPAAVLFAVAFLLPNGWLSTACALPWVGVTFGIAAVGFGEIWRGAWRDGASFSLAAGMAYLSVAGIWAVMERLGFYPFGFNPEIVFLTIVHFHYAGFLLPVLAGLASRQLKEGVFTQITCYFTVAAVGLLAVGITLTNFGIDTDWEMASAWLMALSAAAVAAMHLRLAFLKNNSPRIKWLWAMAAIALLCGMVLAGLYGSRFLTPISWLDIPMMRALHGSLNAVGFGLCAVSGWWLREVK
ncbi:MAG: YndJ family protein [Saprospiraceae bacterium]|nr:YndJ family protein [Saprospiraceae bacterium]MCF8252776.1 YndJ family protein [Saprospiraceae bacterium]MCF8283167.1 YndJ family protein [Bacteroidales bacterium]MCF8314331.1 YndJ family protein [Saprospiraceae bacterium]MCF8443203.1 YndJ family protein [Saprospiraceae bacterium]